MFQKCKQTRHPITAAVISHPVMTHRRTQTAGCCCRLAVAAALFSKMRHSPHLEKYLEISHQLHKIRPEPAAEHLQLFYEEVNLVLSVPTCVRRWNKISSSSLFLGGSMRSRSLLVGCEFSVPVFLLQLRVVVSLKGLSGFLVKHLVCQAGITHESQPTQTSLQQLSFFLSFSTASVASHLF